MDRSVQDGWLQEGTDRGRSYAPSGNGGPPTETMPSDDRLLRLARAIEHDIIPRLMLAHRMAEACPVMPVLEGRHQIGRQDVEQFAKLVLSRDEDLPLACVEQIRARGVSVESIFVDLLGPTARYLGELWTEDLCDFTEVTVGLGRLQRVLRELSPAFGREAELPDQGLRMLLLPSPGEQHTFGLVMVSEFFRRAGWQVSGGPWETALDAADMVATDWYDAVGFSLGSEVHLDSLGDCIGAVRRVSRNRRVAIMVGGPIFLEHPEYAARVGADAVSRDGRAAPAQAAELIDRMASPG